MVTQICSLHLVKSSQPSVIQPAFDSHVQKIPMNKSFRSLDLQQVLNLLLRSVLNRFFKTSLAALQRNQNYRAIRPAALLHLRSTDLQ